MLVSGRWLVRLTNDAMHVMSVLASWAEVWQSKAHASRLACDGACWRFRSDPSILAENPA